MAFVRQSENLTDPLNDYFLTKPLLGQSCLLFYLIFCSQTGKNWGQTWQQKAAWAAATTTLLSSGSVESLGREETQQA